MRGMIHRSMRGRYTVSMVVVDAVRGAMVSSHTRSHLATVGAGPRAPS
ncbi:hypothetical protein [Sporichthya sp.]|nr:hypothetical protein [Sporichthya sp.]MBA3741612.1 hypothetical protein [Sporichthya sp.]